MDVMITVNLWFIVAIGFFCLIIGLLMGGGGSGPRGGGGRHYRW